MIPGRPGVGTGWLKARGAGPDEVKELRAHCTNGFTVDARALARLPLSDEPFVETWAGYVEQARTRGAYAVLRERLVQLRFPVVRGISRTDAYRDATRRGVLPAGGARDGGLRLVRPESVELFVHPTPAGRVPVVVAQERKDFVSLVRAFTCRNEPAPVPDALGGCMVSGYNNWDRVAAHRRAWASDPWRGEATWAAEFRRLRARKDLYQDRFILLSHGPYSATSARTVGRDGSAWSEASRTIRLEHECAHYFARRVLGGMRSCLHDELIADYAGIVAAEGRFRASWFLRFMGLEAFPEIRRGGRLASYRGDPPLSDAAFRVLAAVAVDAARNLEALDARRPAGAGFRARGRRMAALASLSLEVLAAPEAVEAVCAAEGRLRRAASGGRGPTTAPAVPDVTPAVEPGGLPPGRSPHRCLDTRTVV